MGGEEEEEEEERHRERGTPRSPYDSVSTRSNNPNALAAAILHDITSS